MSSYAASISDITSLTDVEHVYRIPDTYIGGLTPEKRPMLCLLLSEMSLRTLEVNVSEGMIRLFTEVIENAFDNGKNSLALGIDPRFVDVNVSGKTVRVINYGKPMPVEMHPTLGLWGPTLNFGKLRTGTSFTENRENKRGRNGFGNKLTNIFSHRFSVYVVDSYRNVSFSQTWTNNMQYASEPIITPGAYEYSSVTVEYDLDFTRLGYPEYYSDELIAIFGGICCEQAFACKIPLLFNGYPLNNCSPRQHCSLLWGAEAAEKAMIFYYWPETAQIITEPDGYQHAVDRTYPFIEMLFTELPAAGMIISYANGGATPDGGKHVSATIDAISSLILPKINKEKVIYKGNRKIKKKKDDKDKKETAPKYDIKPAELKTHLGIIVSVNVSNATYNSQSKTALSGPAMSYSLPESYYKPISTWSIWSIMQRYSELRDREALFSSTKLRGRINSEIVTDANYAGTAKSSSCVFCVAEGDSAKGYIKTALSYMKKSMLVNCKDKDYAARDYIGIAGVKGKILNVLNASKESLLKSATINAIITALGARPDVDYTIPENFATLRYGSLMIMTDQDLDGDHIKGLILVLINTFFPTLLMCGYVKYWITPMHIVTLRGKFIASFDNDADLLQFKQSESNSSQYDYAYMKGLGTSEDKHVQMHVENPRVVTLYYDEYANASILRAFSGQREQSLLRKEWVAQPVFRYANQTVYHPNPTVLYLGNQNTVINYLRKLTDFINVDLLLFEKSTWTRAIPHLTSNLKNVQTMILAGFRKYFKLVQTTFNPNLYVKVKQSKKLTMAASKIREKQKFGNIAGFIGKEYGYHHGENSISEAIRVMAWIFVGSNNIPLINGLGQIGTRDENGKDGASERYIHALPGHFLPYLIRSEDDLILEYRLSEKGKPLEPKTYYPILPLQINGSKGIATGISTSVPSMNPQDVSNWLKCKLMKFPPEQFPKILPWYRGSKATLLVVNSNKKKSVTMARKKAGLSTDITMFSEEEIYSLLYDNPDPSRYVNELGQTLDTDMVNANIAAENEKVSLITLGCYHFEDNKIIVTELPIGCSIDAYRLILKKMVEDKILSSFSNKSDSYSVKFILNGFSASTITHVTLKLVTTIGMSNMNFLDAETGNQLKFDSLTAILEAFYTIRLQKYAERKAKVIEELNKFLFDRYEKRRYISCVLDGTIKLLNAAKDVYLYPLMDSMKLDRKYCKMSQLSLTREKVAMLDAEIAEIVKERDRYSGISIEEMWYKELIEFDNEYVRFYSSEELSLQMFGTLPLPMPCGPR